MRAEGWAEAKTAIAQRNPAAKREHKRILGQSPRAKSRCSESTLRQERLRVRPTVHYAGVFEHFFIVPWIIQISERSKIPGWTVSARPR